MAKTNHLGLAQVNLEFSDEFLVGMKVYENTFVEFW